MDPQSLKEQLDGDYRMDAALHVLADTPLFDVEKDVINRLISAFGDEELAPYFTGKISVLSVWLIRIWIFRYCRLRY